MDGFDPEDTAVLLAYWQSLIAAGSPGETEARMRRSMETINVPVSSEPASG